MDASEKKIVVAVVAFDHISPFHLAIPCAIFGETHPDVPAFELVVCAAERGPLRATVGFTIEAVKSLHAMRRASIVIVPSWRDPGGRPPEELLSALVAAHRRGAKIVGLCLGAFVLGEAGLLAGRTATTHWSYAADFAARFPDVKVDPDVLYVDEGDIVTSAGTAAAIDCCLHLLRQQYGTAIANRVARRLVVSPHRQGGQAQFIEQPLPASTRDSRLSAMLDEVRSTLKLPHSLDALAARMVMSRRTFTRRFRQLTGTTVHQWLLKERLALAQRHLETSDHAIENIADLAGFGSPVSFRQHFRAAFGVTPTAWRQTFAGQPVEPGLN